MASSSTKNLLHDYHKLAAEALGSNKPTYVNEAVLSAAESGNLDRIQNLISQYRGAVNARCSLTGDTPIIAAARNGHTQMIDLLLKFGADVTVQNDSEENALDVASPQLQKHILSSITHEDRAMSNAQAFLQSAWLGDAISVKKHLSGNHYIDVNCRNSEGLTPLLLVTRDITLFEKVQNDMETNYNPVEVVQKLLDSHVDINACDHMGRSALHLTASSESIHARKMVSLLMRRGSTVNVLDKENISPLHVASTQGHTAIIVALVEEGGADINCKGGEHGDTPLMLSARRGHSEAARYLLAKGADVTVVDENGDSAISVAKTSSMVKLLKEAWTEQSQGDPSTMVPPEDQRLSRSLPCSDNEADSSRDSPIGSDLSPLSPLRPEKRSFFLTDRQLSRSLNFEESDFTNYEAAKPAAVRPRLHGSFPYLPLPSEVEADDELEADHGSRRIKPATRRAHIRANFQESLTKRKTHVTERRENRSTFSPRRISGEWKTRTLLRENADAVAYSSADEDFRPLRGSRGGAREIQRLRSREERPRGGSGGHRRVGVAHSGGRPRSFKLALQHSYEETDDNCVTERRDHVIERRDHVTERRDHVTKRRDHVTERRDHVTERREDKGVSFLPEVIKNPPSPKVRSPPRLSASSTPEKLPSLSHLQAVALVAVDADRERLKVHQFVPEHNQEARGRSPKMKRGESESRTSIHRSQSLNHMNISSRGTPSHDPTRSEGVGGNNLHHKKRNSTGSLAAHKPEPGITKVPFLPSVVTPQFGLQTPAPPPHRSLQKNRGRLQPLSLSKAPPKPQPSLISPPVLSVVNEDTESSSSDKTLTKSSSELSQKTRDSTLKASSHPDFETDSLERHGVIVSSVQTRRSPSRNQSQLSARAEASPSVFSLESQHQPSNLVVNYAPKDALSPLSPIWNQMQYFRTDAETTSNSEYITSYIGNPSPMPHMLPPEPRKVGADSGHGESTDEDKSASSSGSEDNSSHLVNHGALKWKRGRLLGKGAYGKVWEGLMDSAKMIAVKEVELDIESEERAQSQYQKIQMEVEILRSLRHKNIVSYLGTSMKNNMVFIFMEFISGGSLQSILRRFGPLDSKTVSHYTRQIARGLDYLHSNGIIHRDIKGANIMVTSRGVVRLIDFGCAKKHCQDMSGGMHSVRGTPYWMAPEVICGLGYGRKSDIWSLGCTVHEMATTKPPWADLPPEAAMFQIGIGTAIPLPPGHLPHKMTAFFFKCLMRDPSQRPSAQELLEDDFLRHRKKSQ